MVNLESVKAHWLSSYLICHREAWLISHGIEGYQDNIYLDLGRFIHEHSYSKEKKEEISLPGMKIDILLKGRKGYVLGEIKSSSKKLYEAKIQLAYYILRLKEYSLKIESEIIIPKEKKRIKVIVDDSIEKEVYSLVEEVIKLVQKEKPPIPIRKSVCSKCAYFEFCWG
ncbi:CRISPR-associated protein Cas4 [Thermosipho ferrireducens]|uniref:CRISPR-associated exonuclease Cas4 n=1 Tax=Thermosipho ferrireducens TaxID=2571116 RepID=A0ABX7S7Z8_9BACT|nr:CRISPR-associated protein Cas4 [Thermosipho ferrireducens]QTA37930.1 CRISPR-associated protein Cas4 [Thermosipho ferrireducens]